MQATCTYNHVQSCTYLVGPWWLHHLLAGLPCGANTMQILLAHTSWAGFYMFLHVRICTMCWKTFDDPRKASTLHKDVQEALKAVDAVPEEEAKPLPQVPVKPKRGLGKATKRSSQATFWKWTMPTSNGIKWQVVQLRHFIWMYARTHIDIYIYIYIYSTVCILF